MRKVQVPTRHETKDVDVFQASPASVDIDPRRCRTREAPREKDMAAFESETANHSSYPATRPKGRSLRNNTAVLLCPSHTGKVTHPSGLTHQGYPNPHVDSPRTMHNGTYRDLLIMILPRVFVLHVKSKHGEAAETTVSKIEETLTRKSTECTGSTRMIGELGTGAPSTPPAATAVNTDLVKCYQTVQAARNFLSERPGMALPG